MTDQNAPAYLVEAVAKVIEIAFVEKTAHHPVRKLAVRLMEWLPRHLAQAAIAAYQAHMASDGVVQADNDQTVKLTEWLIMNDVLDDEGDFHSLHVMHNFGRFSDEAFAAHRRAAALGKEETLSQKQAREVMNPGFGCAVSTSKAQGFNAAPQPDPRDAIISAAQRLLDVGEFCRTDDTESALRDLRAALAKEDKTDEPR